MTKPRFGFTVEYVDEPWLDEDNKPGWKVHLPHRCDYWRIDAGTSYDEGSPQGEALARLDAFIAEAQQARTALARGEQYPPTEEQP